MTGTGLVPPNDYTLESGDVVEISVEDGYESLLRLGMGCGNPYHSLQALLNIILRCSPGRNADSHRGVALPDRTATPTGSLGLQGSYHLLGRCTIPKRNQHLIKRDIIEDLISCG